MSTRPLTGLVVDDHTYMRRSVEESLRACGIAQVTVTDSLTSCRQHLAQHPPVDIAVVDLRLGDGTAMDLIPELRQAGIPVIVFTSADDSYSVRAAYSAGASGYLLKSAPESIVHEAIALVLRGEVHVDPSIAGLLVTGVQVAPRAGSIPLNRREIDILQLAADGLTNVEIAEKLSLTPLAVKGQFVRIGRKLGARDRTQMVAEAMRAAMLR